jgi:peptide chain release factor subunit 1
MDIKRELVELSETPASPAPVLSVFLQAHWVDEQQRDRVRAFVAAELRRVAVADPPPLDADLRWIEARVAAIVAQAELVGARGVAIFACTPTGLRRVMPLRAGFANAVVLAPRPCLRPLIEVLPAVDETLVVCLDREHARLIPIGPEGIRDEVALTGDVPGHHSRGGWAQLAQSRYQRHIEEHRDRHLDAVAAAARGLMHDLAVERVVLMGGSEIVGALRGALAADVAPRVVAALPGFRHEASTELVARALIAAERAHAATTAARVEGTLVEAEKSARAASGLTSTLAAVHRGAVHQLYLLRTFRQVGVECEQCGLLKVELAPACPYCGGPSTVTELGEAAVRRVLSAKGDVIDVPEHAGLAQHGGLAASLRYAL